MVFFRIRWLRRLVRRTMPNMKEDVAEKWYRRLTIVYFLAAWNVFGLVLYSAKTGKLDYAEHFGLKTEQEAQRSKAITTMESLGIPRARVVTIDGLTKVRDEDCENVVLEEELEDRNEEINAIFKRN